MDIEERRLRSTSSSSEFDKKSVIERNIQHMVEKSEKKRYAQEKYYGSSPLKRSNNSNRPVHERLGQRTFRHRNPFLGTNTGIIPPKNPNRRFQNANNWSGNSFNGGISKTFRAQNRINRIRQQQMIARGLDNNNGRIKLRRTLPGHRPLNFRPQNFTNATDLTVQIANPRYQPFSSKRFKMHLNAAMQTEIKVIQARNEKRIDYEIEELVVHYTGVPVNTRFTQYAFN